MTVVLSPCSEQRFVVVIVGILPAAKEVPELMGDPAPFPIVEKTENTNPLKVYRNLQTNPFATI